MAVQQAKLEFQKNERDKIAEIMQLRKQEIDLLGQIIDLSQEYTRSMQRYDNNNLDTEAANNMRRLKLQLDFIKDNFTVMESNLSILENRTPRHISLEFIPPRMVKGITAVVR